MLNLVSQLLSFLGFNCFNVLLKRDEIQLTDTVTRVEFGVFTCGS